MGAGKNEERASKAWVDATVDSFTRSSSKDRGFKQCVLHPYSNFRYKWDFVVIVLMGYTCLFLPLTLADVVRVPIPDLIVNSLFFVDVVLNCFTGYISKSRLVVVEQPKVFFHYLRTWFFPDLAASIPYEELIGLVPRTDEMDVASKLLRSLRILRLARLGRVKERLEMQSTMKQATKMLINFSITGFVIAHTYACIFYALGHVEYPSGPNINRTTWLHVNSETVDLDDWFDTYVAAFYWSLATMSTIGYGDISAANHVERLFSVFVMVTGTAIYAYGITSIFQVLSGPRQYQVRLMQQKDVLSEYLGKMVVPERLKRELREYFIHYERAAMTFHERDMLSVLSPGLRTKVAALANAALLRAVPFFKDAEEGAISEMVLELNPRLYVPGEVIIVQDHIGQELFIIKSGKVVIYIDKPAEDGQVTTLELATLTEGNFFGEGVMLKGAFARRGASARAKMHSIIYTLHCERVDAILENYPAVRNNIELIAKDRDAANKDRLAKKSGGQHPVIESTSSSSSNPAPPQMNSSNDQRRASRGKTATMTTMVVGGGGDGGDGDPSFDKGHSTGPSGQRKLSNRRVLMGDDDSVLGPRPPPAWPSPTNVEGTLDGKSLFLQWADHMGFSEYVPAMAALGYDRVAAVEVASPSAAEELIEKVGMKPGHAAVLRATAQNGSAQQSFSYKKGFEA